MTPGLLKLFAVMIAYLCVATLAFMEGQKPEDERSWIAKMFEMKT